MNTNNFQLLHAHHANSFFSEFVSYEGQINTLDESGTVVRIQLVPLSADEFAAILPAYTVETKHTCALFHSCKRVFALPKIAITCSWFGRHNDRVKVMGAPSLDVARQHALSFADLPAGIILDNGRLETWCYEPELRPADWQDCYVFDSMDEYQPDMREWWEK